MQNFNNNNSSITNMDVTGPNWGSEPYQAMGYQSAAGPMRGKAYTPKSNYNKFPGGNVIITPRFPPYQRKSAPMQQTRQETTAPKPQQYQQQTYHQGKNFVKVGDGLVQTSLNAHKLALSNYKTLTLNEFNGKAYIHLWDNPKKQHVSLNYEELQQLLTHQEELVSTMEAMMLGEALHGDSDMDEGGNC